MITTSEIKIEFDDDFDQIAILYPEVKERIILKFVRGLFEVSIRARKKVEKRIYQNGVACLFSE